MDVVLRAAAATTAFGATFITSIFASCIVLVGVRMIPARSTALLMARSCSSIPPCFFACAASFMACSLNFKFGDA